jgi:hypothetical protein
MKWSRCVSVMRPEQKKTGFHTKPNHLSAEVEISKLIKQIPT